MIDVIQPDSTVVRLAIYERMNSRLKARLLKKDCLCQGFCWAASPTSVRMLTELMKYKPDHNEDGDYWFYRKDLMRRIEILDEITTSMKSELTKWERAYYLFVKLFIREK